MCVCEDTGTLYRDTRLCVRIALVRELQAYKDVYGLVPRGQGKSDGARDVGTGITVRIPSVIPDRRFSA